MDTTTMIDSESAALLDALRQKWAFRAQVEQIYSDITSVVGRDPKEISDLAEVMNDDGIITLRQCEAVIALGHSRNETARL